VSELLVGNPALLIIDMQHDFVDPGAGCYASGAELIVPRIAALAATCRSSGVPVIHTRELHRPGGIDSGRELDCGPGTVAARAGEPAVPWHTVRGTRGAEIVSELGPEPSDQIVDKARFSCFLGTDLEFLLHGLEISTLLIVGVCTDVCVLWTTGDAFQRDYYVRVLEDCTAGSSVERHDAALLIMRSFTYDGNAVLSSEIDAELAGRAA
jgi:nicotinamidase-related amidase